MVIHKGAEAFSLGGALVANDYTVKQSSVFLGVIGALSVFGMMIGTFLTKTNKLLDIIFLSLAGGMMLFVGCSEMIITEFAEGKKYVPLKLLTVLAGATAIGALTQYVEHHPHDANGGHGHGHYHH